MIIGLGSSTEAIVSNWHGQHFAEPLKRMREYTECIRLIIAGEKVCYTGEIISVRNFGLLNPPPRKSIPILIAAVNQKMTSVALGLGDGILLYLRPVDELVDTVKNIKRLSNRRPFEIALSIICAVSDKDPERAKERAAMTLVFYIAVGKYYRQFLSENGFEIEVAEIVSAYKKGGTKAVLRAVPESMVKSLTVSGSTQECRDSLQRFSATGITLPILQVNPIERDESSFREFISSL
jgi:alkanesulfonate monooxygenase SsuD/methylene tetrahydromethanopterin reductase-like flavin-dependent oxidoreductase (luciferase family)